jgi:hypothetical protein
MTQACPRLVQFTQVSQTQLVSVHELHVYGEKC